MAAAYPKWIAECFVELSKGECVRMSELLAKISLDGELSTERARRRRKTE